MGMWNDKLDTYQPQKDIVDLMTLYGQEVKTSPELPDEKTLLLRARLVFEEAMEFVRACGCSIKTGGPDHTFGLEVHTSEHTTPDLKEYVDACGDQLVVTYGALNAAGVSVKPVWDEIHRSNMSKTWTVCSVCDQPLVKDSDSKWRHEDTASCKNWSPVWVIRKRADGKVIKPDTYSWADLDKVIAKQIRMAK